jgi:hypothetical protein
MTQNASDKAKGVPETPKKKLIEVALPARLQSRRSQRTTSSTK